MSVFEELKKRGLIAQMTHEEQIVELLQKEKVTFYIGFDPTADSLHVGHYLQLVVMAHLQKAGHRPIAILGGGTAMVGDPSGKTDMRRMMTKDEIDHNANCFKLQMSKLIDFSDEKALMVNNADWLLNLNYIEFLREVGVHFSVNRMLTQECFKKRLEKGLSFLEFNYTLMQSYDFLVLNRKYNCKLELGGDDQWSNIIGGVELLRRSDNKDAYGMTFTLLTTSDGRKMGKTEKGAVWLDPEKTSPYEFYQYWRNIDDADVVRCLKMLTFIPVDEIESEFGHLEGKELNRGKEVLAYEITKQVHGEVEAKKAQEAAKTLFVIGSNSENMPTVLLSASLFQNDFIPVLDLLVAAKVTASKSEARRLVEQGGLSINDIKIVDTMAVISKNSFSDNYITLKKGKKSFFKVALV